jgi:hypothetical protein
MKFDENVVRRRELGDRDGRELEVVGVGIAVFGNDDRLHGGRHGEEIERWQGVLDSASAI